MPSFISSQHEKAQKLRNKTFSSLCLNLFDLPQYMFRTTITIFYGQNFKKNPTEID